jgi:hypothetical protein
VPYYAYQVRWIPEVLESDKVELIASLAFVTTLQPRFARTSLRLGRVPGRETGRELECERHGQLLCYHFRPSAYAL